MQQLDNLDKTNELFCEENIKIAKTAVKAQTIKEAINGSKSAFSELFMATYKKVFFIMRKYFRNDEDICDAIQITYEKAYTGIKHLRTPEAFEGWLSRIAHNTAKDIVQQNNELCLEANEITPDNATASDVSIDIKNVLSQIPEQEAKLLISVYYDGMRIADIARAQNIPFSTLHSRFLKAKQHLKQQLKINGIEKPFYSGDMLSMLSTSIRDAIGTQLLSFSVAEEILMLVLNQKTPSAIVLKKILIKKRNSAILKLAAIILAITVLFSSATTLLINGTFKTKNDGSFSSSDKQTANNSYSSQSSSSKPGKINGIFGFITDLFDGDKDDASSIQSTSSNQATYSSQKNETSSSKKPSSSSKLSSSSSKTSSTASNFMPEITNAGNMAHNNSSHCGSVAIKDGYIYYSTFYSDNNTLYKMKYDGSEKQKLYKGSSSGPHINIVGDWIYFLTGNYSNVGYLSKIRTDGTGYKNISTKGISNFITYGNSGYFTCKEYNKLTLKDEYCAYHIDLKTEKMTLITNKLPGERISFTEKYIICTDDSNPLQYTLKIYSLKTGALVKALGNGWHRLYKDKLFHYNNNIVKIYNLNNIDAAPSQLPFTLKNGFKCYSPYKGGYIIGNSNVYSFADNKEILWPFVWSNAQSIDRYTTFDDGYVYFINEDILYRQYPDGTGFEAIGYNE